MTFTTRRGTRRAPAVGFAVGAALALGALGACSSAPDGAQPTSSSTSEASSSVTTTTGASTATGSESTATTSTTPAEPQVRTVQITVTGRTVEPRPARVELARGAVLRLVVTSDHDDALHAHGFEVEKELTAGQPTTVDLTGGEPGLYEVETHHPSLRLLQVLVR